MKDIPYNFIDTKNPEKKQAEKKMEEAAEEGKLFGEESEWPEPQTPEDIPTRSKMGSKFTQKEINPEDWPETKNRVFHHEENRKKTVGPIGIVLNILKSIFR